MINRSETIEEHFHHDDGNEVYDNIMDEIAEYGPYSDESIQFPSLDGIEKGVIPPQIFYKVYADPDPVSEMSAVTKYIRDQVSFAPASNIILGISIIEMRHLDHVVELIKALGGSVYIPFDTIYIPVPISAYNAVEQLVSGEEATISYYQGVRELLFEYPESETRDICEQFMDKLIADETLHRDAGLKWLENNS